MKEITEDDSDMMHDNNGEKEEGDFPVSSKAIRKIILTHKGTHPESGFQMTEQFHTK